jgi:DNA-binding PucR family transcriptional regulator
VTASIAPTAATGSDERPTLKDLLEILGSDLVEVVATPHGINVPVNEPVIYDPTERHAIVRGAVVLAVGVQPGTSQSLRVLTDAGQAGAAAVVFKRTREAQALAAGEAATGVAVLSVPEELTWTQLHAFVLNVSRFSAQESTGTGIAGVPLGDLFALANAIAGMVGGAVTIEDPSRRVLAYSTLDEQPIDGGRRRSILGRQVPDIPGMRQLYQQLFSTSGVMTADATVLRELLDIDDLRSRSAVAIRAGTQAIGSIWVVHDTEHLDEEAERALSEAARIALPHVIQARAARDVDRRMRAEMVLAVLEGRGSAEEIASRLGFAPSEPLSLLALQLRTVESSVDELERERLVDLVGFYCEVFRRSSAAVAVGHNVYVLLQGKRTIVSERLVELAREIQAHAETRIGLPLLAAIGSTVENVHDVPRARREVENVLTVLGNDARGRTVATVDDVRSEVVILELREASAARPGLVRGKLERVVAHDSAHGTAYVQTLRAYLDAFGDVAAAATQTSVHPNTFRYRMRRLVELCDLDLENPEERLVIELQLRLLGNDTSRRQSSPEREPSAEA